MGPNDVTHRSGSGMVYYFFVLYLLKYMYIYSPLTMACHDGGPGEGLRQEMLRQKMGLNRPNGATVLDSPSMLYFLFVFFFLK